MRWGTLPTKIQTVTTNQATVVCQSGNQPVITLPLHRGGKTGAFQCACLIWHSGQLRSIDFGCTNKNNLRYSGYGLVLSVQGHRTTPVHQNAPATLKMRLQSKRRLGSSTRYWRGSGPAPTARRIHLTRASASMTHSPSKGMPIRASRGGDGVDCPDTAVAPARSRLPASVPAQGRRPARRARLCSSNGKPYVVSAVASMLGHPLAQ
jgi:hypothetical protein